MTDESIVLDVRDQVVEISTRRGTVHAVNGISYQLRRGETLAVVGESGSGKSVQYLSMLGLLPAPPARVRSGCAKLLGHELFSAGREELRQVLGRDVGIVFQDPMTSLNPVLPVGLQITERLEEHLGLGRRAAHERAVELLDLVGIAHPRVRVGQFPHEFSGGMRQRVMIAMALSCEPRLLIADEPTTALDVTVQAQIIELVQGLQARLHMALLWITHDLGVVAGLADTVQVMYAGRIVERGPVRAIFRDPRNAYTAGLLRSLPDVSRGGRTRLQQIQGSPPDLHQLPAGDAFAPRNAHATERCFREVPALRPVPDGDPAHRVAAWYDVKFGRELAA